MLRKKKLQKKVSSMLVMVYIKEKKDSYGTKEKRF